MELLNQGARAALHLEDKPIHSVRLREASLADHDAISSLESRHGLETKSYEEWSHLWVGNPAYNHLSQKWPVGWILEDEDNQVVGSLSNIPLWYEFQEQKLTAASGHSWVVDSSYRSYALLLLDQYFSQKNVDFYIGTTLSSQASKAFGLFGSSRVPVGTWDRSAFWITQYRGFAASLLAMKAFPLTATLSYPLSLALWFKHLPFNQTLKKRCDGAEVQPCGDFDGRFDAFWQALKSRDSHSLLAVRTQEVLRWHFRYPLLKKRLWILTITDLRGLAAYAVFCRQDNPGFGLKRIRLVDFQTLDGDTSLLLPMLSWALKRCREERIHMLELVGFGPQQGDSVDGLAPFQRRLPSWGYYYRVTSQSLAQSLADPKVWSPSLFDGDASI